MYSIQVSRIKITLNVVLQLTLLTESSLSQEH